MLLLLNSVYGLIAQ